MRSVAIIFGSLALAGAQAQAQAAAPEARPSANSSYRVSRQDDGGKDRAALGVSTQSTGKRDTLGLLVTSVTPNSPADKAGIVEGDRIASVNGTSLKVAPADAGEPDMNGVMTRRLVRTMNDLKPGDDVTLVLYTGGAQKTVKVKTVAWADLRQDRQESKDRAALGIAFGGGSMRDTLGLFVESVTPGGPADKAGIEEGNRIAAINGVDVRIPAAEAESGDLVFAKMSRLTRVLGGVKAGDAVDLRVYAGGTYKTVKVTTVAASALWKEHAGRGMRMWFGDDGMPPMPPMPAMAPMPPMPPMPPMHMRVEAPMAPDATTMSCVSGDDGNVVCTNSVNRQVERAMRSAERASRTAMAYSYGYGSGRGAGRSGANSWNLSGLRLTDVTPGLASYFGPGSDKGLLVLAASDNWAPLKTGDVVLTVNGRPVERDGGNYFSVDTDKDNTFGILRKAKKMTVIVKAQ